MCRAECTRPGRARAAAKTARWTTARGTWTMCGPERGRERRRARGQRAVGRVIGERAWWECAKEARERVGSVGERGPTTPGASHVPLRRAVLIMNLNLVLPNLFLSFPSLPTPSLASLVPRFSSVPLALRSSRGLFAVRVRWPSAPHLLASHVVPPPRAKHTCFPTQAMERKGEGARHARRIRRHRRHRP